MNQALYRPPAPRPLGPTVSLLRMIARGERDLLSLVPSAAYRELVTPLGVSRRSILLVNDPGLAREILTDPLELFPKNDLMKGALEPLVGRSIFVADGEPWRRQRRMVEQAFTHMAMARAFPRMEEGLAACEERLDRHAEDGTPVSLDATMGRLTADIICRTIFSAPLDEAMADEVFRSFTEFERSVANVDILRLLLARPFAAIRQRRHVTEACERIRAQIDLLLAPRLEAGAERRHDPEGAPSRDIAGDLIAARDPATGEGFTRDELIDQVGVFFLAGHETTASVLTWCFFILAERHDVAARLLAELGDAAGEGRIGPDVVRRLEFTRAVFRETLRLYPPITFIPRVAARDTELDGRRVRRGAMIMIAPWTTHRCEALWPDADRFDPDRFSPEREKAIVPGSYFPFGLGPRICVGAGFALTEAVLILARLSRRYAFEVIEPGRVRPVARLTTRPAREILALVRRRDGRRGDTPA